MGSLKRKRIAVTVTAIAAAAGAFSVGILGGPTGCTSNCKSNCPPASIYIGDLNNTELPINAIAVDGPACPPQYGVYCTGDGQTTTCTHVTITGFAEGMCDVVIVFSDRPTEIVHTQFGPPIMQGCCTGYSIIGDSVFIIPNSSDAGISGLDGPTDQVSFPVDAGADAADGGVDGSDAD
ncbi:MAG TPA: hypothetical protein VKQ32_02365 [Polyangia bacterium]|nr:hypothetical protein [Polyangia bacterium]